MKRGSFLIILSTAILLTLSCKSEITKPEEPPAGRRDYVWDVTEIKPGNEALQLTDIWGTSPQNIWTVGSSSYSATQIWHFNGNQWRCDSIPRYVQPSAIWGSSPNEVWLGNVNNTIWKYNGTAWSKFGEYNVSGYDVTWFQGMTGTSRSDIYAVGSIQNNTTLNYKAIIVHYNGVNWQFEDVPATKVGLAQVEIDPKTGTLVIYGLTFENTVFTERIFCWDGKELKELLAEQGSAGVTKLGDEVFVTMNERIYKYENKGLVLWKDNTGTGIYGNIICGRSRNDFFIGSSAGIRHYNGTDFVTVYDKTDLRAIMGVIFEKEVFMIHYSYDGKNYVVHGKLN
ncbi:MAG: hypothetical protein FD122_3456 [Stygiobacter sp.]|nr:MAG: hypothetical protein FD122_3456 [Stygiobacter sp.]KAF0211722.1 MAG: hypothetical protein FD178_3362 [Ignavibacteria bacterium]